MKKLIIIRGLPSSGKSFLANELYQKYYQGWTLVKIFSTDNYWLRQDGVYDFNCKFLTKAHQWNYNSFCEYLESCNNHFINDRWITILDNTNITYNEFSNYIITALKYKFDIEIIEPSTRWKYNVEECFKLNLH